MRSLLVAGVAATLAASGSIASAGTYIGLGIGTAPSVGNDTIPNPNNDGRSYRGLLGYSFGNLSIEGELNHFGLLLNGDSYSSTMLGVGLKYGIPLGYGFDVFGRAGLQRTWLSSNADIPYYQGSGNGLYLGVGVEYQFIALASVFVDYERQSATITAPMSTNFGESAGMFTVGAALHF